MPNRRPTMMPTRLVPPSVLHTSRLKQAVDSRRPCCFTNSMSRLARRKRIRSPALRDMIRMIRRGLSGPLRSTLRPESAGPLTVRFLETRPCLRKTRGMNSVRRRKAVLDRQTRAALGSAAGQDLPAVFCAHAFSESVFALLFEVRRLLKRKRHTDCLSDRYGIEGRIIGTSPHPVKPRDLSTSCQ